VLVTSSPYNFLYDELVPDETKLSQAVVSAGHTFADLPVAGWLPARLLRWYFHIQANQRRAPVTR